MANANRIFFPIRPNIGYLRDSRVTSDNIAKSSHKALNVKRNHQEET